MAGQSLGQVTNRPVYTAAGVTVDGASGLSSIACACLQTGVLASLLRTCIPLLSQATKRELDSLSDQVPLSQHLRSDLELTWDHYHCAAFLMASLAIVEAVMGPRAWTKQSAVPQEEFAVLQCIRNALTHNGGDISRNTDKSCSEKVRRFRDSMSSGELVWGSLGGTVLEPYYSLDENEVVLASGGFQRIYSLIEALL